MKEEQILILDERLDSGNIEEFKKKTAALINSENREILLDFSATKFIDSIGLGSLVSILKQATQREKRVALCALSPQVRQIFELTRLYRLFDIFDSQEDASTAIST